MTSESSEQFFLRRIYVLFVVYIANLSNCFLQSYLLRRTHTTGVAPQGVEVNLGQKIVEPIKTPLPIDFTKEIVSNRINVLPKLPQPALADKFDIQVAQTPTTNIKAPTNLFRLVETSTGAYLMPLTNITTTVNTNTTPISTPAEITSQVTKDNVPDSSDTAEEPLVNEKLPVGNKQHCSCCIMLRKICKTRQTTINEYFSRNKAATCYCNDIKYPKVTNRLRILVSNFKNNSMNALQCIEAKLKRKVVKDEEKVANEGSSCNMDDFGEYFVTYYSLIGYYQYCVESRT